MQEDFKRWLAYYEPETYKELYGEHSASRWQRFCRWVSGFLRRQ